MDEETKNKINLLFENQRKVEEAFFEQMQALSRQLMFLELKTDSFVKKLRRKIYQWRANREMKSVLKSSAKFTRDLLNGKEKL